MKYVDLNRQYGQGSVKQTGEGRCVFWPTVDTSVEGTWHQVAYQTGSVHGCSHDIPALWLRDMGSLQEAVEDARPVSPRCLRKIMGISWEDCVPNTEVLHRANMPGVEALIIKAQLRRVDMWFEWTTRVYQR